MTKLIKPHISEYPEILTIIKDGRSRAFQALNVALIETYWAVGGYLSRKVAESGWGKGAIRELADWLLVNASDIRGFSASNLWRMMQFYDTYASDERLAPLVRALSWSKNLLILGQCKTFEEKEFYLLSSARANWSKRELQAQIQRSSFERTMLANIKLAPPVRELHQDVTGAFKDTYLLDFLNLPEPPPLTCSGS